MATDWDAEWAELFAEQDSRPAAEYPSFSDDGGHIVCNVILEDEYLAIYLLVALVIGLVERRLGRVVLCIALSMIASGLILANAGYRSLGGERFVWAFAFLVILTLALSEAATFARNWISSRLPNLIGLAKGEKVEDKNHNDLW